MSLPKLRILLIDDNEEDLFLASYHLSKIDTFEIEADKESNYKEARNKILQDKHDVYIVDYLLGPRTGLDLLREVTAAGINKPYILLTGKGERKIDLEATKAGAYDYLTKSDLNSELLERSLRYSVQRYSFYKALLENEKKYREIFLRSNDIIFMLDDQTHLVDFNPAMNRVMGYEGEELKGQPLRSIFETPAEADKLISEVREDGSKGNIEIKLVTKPGLRKTFLASFSKIIGPDESWVYQVILYDYTSIKKSVEEQMFKEKLEATSRLVRSLAHEIRNPLTNINLSAHQLEGAASEGDKVYLEIVKRNSKRINDLITELMNMSNPSEKKFERIELNNMVHSALLNAMDRIELKKIGVSENLIPEPLYVLGDKEKIEMAVLNIIINAVEAIEGEKGKLDVETSFSGNKAYIRIKDNGTGIPAENIPDLFQPYFTRKKNGIGLGLATTRSVIQAHNGSIEVESSVGEGSMFTVSFQTV